MLLIIEAINDIYRFPVIYNLLLSSNIIILFKGIDIWIFSTRDYQQSYISNIQLYYLYMFPRCFERCIDLIKTLSTIDVSYDLRFEICIYLSRGITAIANGQMAAGPGKDQWQVGPGHWQHFVVHLRYPGVPSIIEGRAGAAEVDFPPLSRKRMEKGDRVGYTRIGGVRSKIYTRNVRGLFTRRKGDSI